MASKGARLLSATVLWMLLASWLVSCAPQSPAPTPTDPNTFEVDPVFREFYDLLGAQDRLGPAISDLFTYEEKRCQYTYNVLMCYDPLGKEASRFFLYPLGRFLNLQPDTAESAADPGSSSVSIDGIPIYADFLPLYDQLNGSLYAGRPLTTPRTNYLQNRIEQYFENVGFYLDLDDPNAQVRLLAYGGYLCDLDCRYKPEGNHGAIIRTGGSEVDQPFLTSLIRMGGLSIFGQPLTQPYRAVDGSLEQIYENVVLYSQQEDFTRPRLRSVPDLLGIPRSPMGPEITARGMIFYPVEDGYGYLVPEVFDQFIAQHGGIEISGQPINSVWKVKENLYRQCFEHYCLDYNHAAADPVRVRLATLGPEYLQRTQLDPSYIVRYVYSPDTVLLEVSEDQPQLAPDQTQTIVVRVLRKLDRMPIPDVEGVIRLRLPDGREFKSRFPPTAEDGSIRIKIKPLGVENGSLISYEVCLNVPSEQRICAAESYLIWAYP